MLTSPLKRDERRGALGELAAMSFAFAGWPFSDVVKSGHDEPNRVEADVRRPCHEGDREQRQLEPFAIDGVGDRALDLGDDLVEQPSDEPVFGTHRDAPQVGVNLIHAEIEFGHTVPSEVSLIAAYSRIGPIPEHTATC